MPNKITIRKILLHSLMIIVCFICIYPLFIMYSDSMKSAGELAENAAGLPSSLNITNYLRLLKLNTGIITTTFMNSLFITTCYTIISLLLSSVAGYSFSKFEYPFKNKLFYILLITMMVPVELLMPPLYLLFSKINWLNTFKVMIFPGTANVFALFMYRQYIDTIPDSLIEAAKIDGIGFIRTYLKIILPLATPATGALAVLISLSKWNEYLFPKLMIMDQKKMPIMVILPTLNETNSSYAHPWELILAGCVLVTTPLIILFLIFQEKFMSSMTVGAVKE